VSLAVYAIGRAAMHEWAASALGACPVVVDDPGLEAQPAGTHWLCVADDLETLRARRPDDDYTVVEPTPAVAWSSLAHDVRGPIGVVRGALAELASEDPMIPLAQRAVGRLVHLTECWDALEAAPERSEVDVAELLAEAHEELASLEPRRATKVVLEPSSTTLVADPTRLRLGLVRLLAHVTRVSRETITLSVDTDGAIVVAGAVGEDLSPEAAGGRSSRLSLAIALLAPITERWVSEEGALRWYARSS